MEATEQDNLLPCDGSARLTDFIRDGSERKRIFNSLLHETEWKNDEVMMYGKRIVTARKTAWYGDKGMAYTYSGIQRTALPWTPLLLELRDRVSEHTGHSFNACLLNLYHSGAEGMSWHSDDEPELGPQPVIASLSFGAERRFSFRHKKSGERTDIQLPDGSLLLMSGTCQQHWKHALPKSLRVKEARINLTFRQMLR